MDKFTTLTSNSVPLNVNNVDTDQIIQARFLLMITKDGYGDHLFEDWRYREDGSENPEFILNDPKFKGAEILLAGDNFGSGSSREHAVWAIKQYGFKVVISTSFSDIFRNNAYGNGLLVLTVQKGILEKLFSNVDADPTYKITVDLPGQTMSTADGMNVHFDINPFVKEKIINGLDNIGYILSKEDDIKSYEKRMHKDELFRKSK